MNLASLLALASFSSKSRRSLFDIVAKRSCSALVFSLFASFSAFAAAFSAFAIAIARRRAYSRSRASTALSAFSCSFRRASILAADFNSSRAIERCFSSASLTIRSRASCAARFSLYRFLESAVTGAAFPFFPAALLDLPALAFFPPDFWRFASSDFRLPHVQEPRPERDGGGLGEHVRILALLVHLLVVLAVQLDVAVEEAPVGPLGVRTIFSSRRSTDPRPRRSTRRSVRAPPTERPTRTIARSRGAPRGWRTPRPGRARERAERARALAPNRWRDN